MRFCVQFELAKAELPKDFRPLFVSFLKNCLSKYGQEYFDAYYKDGDTIMKSFTFGVRMNRPKFCGDKVLLAGNKVAFTLSTPDMRDGMILYNAIVNSKTEVFPVAGQNKMTICTVRLEQEREIREREIVIKMLSPLVLREHDRETNKDRYIDAESPDFAEKTEEIVRAQLDIFGLDTSAADGFSIMPVKPKTTVVTVFGHHVDVSLGVYKLNGKPELLQFLYEAGIGSRRSQGMGMFEILA